MDLGNQKSPSLAKEKQVLNVKEIIQKVHDDFQKRIDENVKNMERRYKAPQSPEF